MISDITLGQFFPGKSPIHRLDPRTKIILATLFIVSVFIAGNPVSFAFLTLTTIILIAVSGISFRVIRKSIKPIVFILIFNFFTFFFHILIIVFFFCFIKIYFAFLIAFLTAVSQELR